MVAWLCIIGLNKSVFADDEYANLAARNADPAVRN